jgi:hypothetical protein
MPKPATDAEVAYWKDLRSTRDIPCMTGEAFDALIARIEADGKRLVLLEGVADAAQILAEYAPFKDTDGLLGEALDAALAALDKPREGEK